MNTPALFHLSKRSSAGAGRPDQSRKVGAAHIAEAVAAIVCGTLASAIIITAIALVML
jgi:hypothetical protein